MPILDHFTDIFYNLSWPTLASWPHGWWGSPHQKLKKKKFVLKWFLGNFKGFKLIFFSKKKKINNGKLVHCWPHPPTLVENSTILFIPSLQPKIWRKRIFKKNFDQKISGKKLLLQKKFCPKYFSQKFLVLKP